MRPLETMASATRSLTSALTSRRAAIGEATGEQSRKSRDFWSSLGGAAEGNNPGFDRPRPGTFKLYREISSHATVAEVMQIVTSPIRANQWGYKVRKGTPEDQVEFYREVMDGIRAPFMKDALTAPELGFAPFEPIWGIKDGRTVIERFKPLSVENTDFICDKETGKVVGLENKSPGKDPVKLLYADRKAFVYTYDGACGNPYGRSRHENIRKDYCDAFQIADRLGRFFERIAGVTGVIHYPDGESLDASGSKRPNFWLALQLAEKAQQGKFLFFPNGFADTDNLRTSYELAGKSQWLIDYKDPGGVDYANGLLAALAYYDKRLFRGWLRSERVGLEGEHGMKADSKAHTDTGIKDSELIDQDIAEALSRGPGDELMVMNFGEGARGSITIEPAPIADNSTENNVEILKAGLADPNVGPLVARKIDWDEVLEDLDIPVDESAKGPLPEFSQPDTATQPSLTGKLKGVRDRLAKAGHSPEVIESLLKKKGKAA